MKFLYYILVVCAAVNSEPVPPTQEQLKSVANNILQQIEHAPEKIDEFVEEAKVIVGKKVLEHELVKNIKSIMKEKEKSFNNEDGEPTPESKTLHDCIISIAIKFKKLADEINNDILKKLTVDRFSEEGKSLTKLNKTLSDMKDILKNHADEEIKTCLDGESKCRLTGEFLSLSEDYFTFEDLLKPTLISMIESYDGYFNSPELGNNIDTDLTHPGYECLNGKK